MNLIQALANINTPLTSPLKQGYSKDIQSFWSSFVCPLLPKKETVLKWHDVLMEYVRQENAMFAIRAYNTAPKNHYDRLRRGFLTATNQKYSFFYTDNFHAAYYLKMVQEDFVPSVGELLSLYNNRQFPARFGKDTQEERQLMAIPKGKDPGIQKAGYKIAHILNVGKEYFYEGRSFSLSDIIKKYFDGGTRKDWQKELDSQGEYYIRHKDMPPDARQFLVAEFLRFVHPFNYFLAPKKSCIISAVCKDISEFQPVINYIQSKYYDMYGRAYQEFLKIVLAPHKNLPTSLGAQIINLKFENSPGIKKKGDRIFAAQGTHKTKIKDMLCEYLNNPNTSFRQLERKYLGINSPNRGGGFVAKKIINSYGIFANMKGILNQCTIQELYLQSNKQLQEVLSVLKKELEK